jgi:hypothetical protein
MMPGAGDEGSELPPKLGITLKKAPKGLKLEVGSK